MRLSQFYYFLLIILSILSCSAALNEAPLKLSIVPERSDEKDGASIRPYTPFYVVIRNQSDKPVRVWRELNSWGYYCLSLEARSPDGKIFLIKKKQIFAWNSNFPDPFLIQAGEYFVIQVILKDVWEGYPVNDGKLSLRAHYKIEADADKASKDYNIWTGELVSPWIEVMFY